MKLCVFQGTFNPIHNAHLQMAQYVKDNYHYDKIIFIPAFIPPHKDIDPKNSQHRLNMVKLATEDVEFEVSDIEYKMGEISYTYLTLCELYKRYDIEGKIGFIIGADAFLKIESWYETDKLKNLVDFILFRRNDNFDVKTLALLQNKGYKFNMTDMELVDISSTDIRERLAQNKSIKELLPFKVLEYIENYGLYRNK